MSQKKIVRLKTPIKIKEPLKTPEETMATNIYCNETSTIMRVEHIQVSQNLQITLINEINKLYKDMDSFKRQITEYKEENEELAAQKKKMRSRIQLIQKEHIMYKNMYELERQNHERLRKFYEQRQKEWIQIIEQQRKILQEQSISNGTTFSYKSQKSIGLLSITSKRNVQNPRQQTGHLKGEVLQIESQPQIKENTKKIKKVVRKNCTSAPKYIYIDDRENKASETNKKESTELMLQSKKADKKRQIKNLKKDETFDLILRKIYYQNRQNQISIDQISRTQDMVKLKKAKTSTRDRLIKTLKKLSNHKEHDEIIVFCDYVQQQVINRHKILLGDLVYNFIIQKLRECQRLALSSNSFISYIEKSKSFILEKPSNRQIALQQKRVNSNDLNFGQFQIQTARNDSQLQLNSIAKIPFIQSVEKAQMLEDNFDQVRYSISSLRNLSDLINGETAYLLDETKMMENKTFTVQVNAK